MLTALLLLWFLTGGFIASAIMIRVWLLDPPPGGGTGRFFGVLIGGLVGGALGGYATHSLSDPMPGIVGALSAGTILSGIVAVFTARRA